MAATVHLVASDPALCRVLKSRIEREAGLSVICRQDGIGRVAPGSLVLSTTTDIVPEQVARLSAGGAKVIVLAAIPRQSDDDRYMNAGAVAYVAMTIKMDQLLREISSAIARSNGYSNGVESLRGLGGLQGIAG